MAAKPENEDRGWLLAHARVSGKIHAKIKGEDKLAFFQQLATLIKAGCPLLEALQLCAGQCQSSKLAAVIKGLADRVAAGSALNVAAADHPKIFEAHWIQVIKTGESTGQLATVLGQLTQHVRDAREARGKLVSAMIYPAVLLCVAVGALTVMLWLVVPTFAGMFKDFGAKLPGITQAVIDLSDFLRERGFYLLFGLTAAIFGIRRYLRTEQGGRIFSSVLLVLPVIGELSVQAAMVKFAANLALLLRSGMPLMEALQGLRGVFHSNGVYREALTRAEQRVASGGSLSQSVERTGLFTPMIVTMIKTGEESGQLPDVLDQVAGFYKQKVSTAVTRATGLIEPCIILGMGVAVAVLLMSIYMPMFQLASGVH